MALDATAPEDKSLRHAFSITAPQLARLLSQTGDDSAGDASRESPLELVGGQRGLARALRVDLSRGVDRASVAQRRAWFGQNRVEPPKRRSRARIGCRVVFRGNAPTILLILLALQLTVNTLDRGDSWGEAACVTALAVGLTILKFRVAAQNERRARELFAAQTDMGVRVWRDGVCVSVTRSDLVVGDVVQLRVGDIVPADGVMVAMDEPVAVDESAVTGESEWTTKNELASGKTAIVWAGTTIQRGRGRMMVLCVGEHTMEGLVLSLIDGRRLPTEAETNDGTYAKLESPSALAMKRLAPGQGSLEATARRYRAVKRDKGTETAKEGTAKPPFFEQIDSLEQKILSLACLAAVVVMVTLLARTPEDVFEYSGASAVNGCLVMALMIVVLATAENIELVWASGLAVVSRELKKNHVLLQQSLATFTAGSVSVLCTDKTGTLTMCEMRVHDVWVAPDEDGDDRLGRAAETSSKNVASAESSKLLAHQILKTLPQEILEDPHSADPTERALLEFAHAHLEPSLHTGPADKIRVLPFTNESKRKTVVVKDPSTAGSFHVLTQGAPEMVLPLCSSIRTAGGRIKRVNAVQRDALLAGIVDRWASEGKRVLCFAYRKASAPSSDVTDSIMSMPVGAVESDLVCLAVVALEDPVRPEAPRAISMLQDAGISICMVTGDHLSTAMAVARHCGIVHDDMADEEGLTGMDAGMFRELVTDADGSIKQAEFDRVWPKIRVLARATPADKYLLVDALKSTTVRGRECVAVTGNGTNDAAALKHSELGIALGASGTEVCKRASEIVLHDDNLLSMVNLITWGRVLQAVVHEALLHQLIVIVVVLTITLLACFMGIYSPLDGSQIVWTKLCMNVLASFGLGAAPRLKIWSDVMTRPPLRPDASVVSLRSWLYVAGHTLHQLCVLLVLSFWGDSLFQVPSGQSRLARRQAMPSTDSTHVTTRALGAHALDSAAASTQFFMQSPSSVHFTIVFNTFLWMHLFLLLRPARLGVDSLRRLVQRERCGFLLAWLALGVLQVVIVQRSGNGFNCEALSLVQWLASVLMAASSLGVEKYLRRVLFCDKA